MNSRPEEQRIGVWAICDEDFQPESVGSKRYEEVWVVGKRHQ